MEFRTLQYFLAVAREESISGAAEYLHLTQPTLSRQMQDLEKELGKPLFIRGSRKISLTESGYLLQKRAEEITALVSKTTQDIRWNGESVSGHVYIGAGETEAIHLPARAAHALQSAHPNIVLHIVSGDTPDVLSQLNRGLLDFGILFEPKDLSTYEYLEIPHTDVWGVLMREDAPLASVPQIAPSDLWDKPLILPRQHGTGSKLLRWLGKEENSLHISATYSLLYNGAILAEEGLGYALCLDHIINTADTPLCFRPLSPSLEVKIYIVWKKQQILSKPAAVFLQSLTDALDTHSALTAPRP